MNKEKFKIKQFEKFYFFLMEDAPKDYVPWFFPLKPNGKDPDAFKIINNSPKKSICCNADWILRITKDDDERKIKSKPQWRCDTCEKTKGSWHSEHARLSKEQCIEHIKQGYNLGLSARTGDPLIIIDIDEEKYLDQTLKNTLSVISRKRAGSHTFGWDKDGTAKINLPTDFGEIRSDNQYVVSCGSYVPFNLKDKKDKKAFEHLPEKAKKDPLLGFYTIDECSVPRAISFNELPKFFRDKEMENIESEAEIKNKNIQKKTKEDNKEGKYSELFNLKVSDILDKIPKKKRIGHPLHESDTDANFSLSKDGDLAHCWRHLVSLNAVQYLCVKAGYKSCVDCGTPHKGRGISKIKGDKKAFEVAYKEALKMGFIKEYIENKPKSKEAQEVDILLEEVSKMDDPVDRELEFKKIKEKTGLSIKILREKTKEKRINRSKNNKEVTKLPQEIDERFNQENLLIDISNEISKDHIQDNREKLGAFLVGISGYLPNPKDHVSAAFKGNSSAGKDNIVLSILKHIPAEDWARATRITQSEMEDRLGGWKILAVSEINKNREGANSEIVETFKQIMEDGLRIFKKDNITGEPKEIEVEQKTGFYGTTETQSDDELETRYIVIPIRGSEIKNRNVISTTLNKSASIEAILDRLKKEESWISKSIRGLDKNLDVLIPYANELKEKFETAEGEKEIFDYSKERVKRDVKRLLSLTKAITWIYQKRRVILEVEDKKIIVAEPTDFLTALKIFTPFFNLSYSGLDPRFETTLEKIKDLEGKYTEEINNAFGDNTRADWVIRSELQRELGIDSVNTIKEYINSLKDKGLIKVYWNESHPRLYLIRPVNRPISSLLEPITLQAMTCRLIGEWTGKDIYKNNNKKNLDIIPLVKSIEINTTPEELIPVRLIGQLQKDMPPSLFIKSEKIDFSKLKLGQNNETN